MLIHVTDYLLRCRTLLRCHDTLRKLLLSFHFRLFLAHYPDCFLTLSYTPVSRKSLQG